MKHSRQEWIPGLRNTSAFEKELHDYELELRVDQFAAVPGEVPEGTKVYPADDDSESSYAEGYWVNEFEDRSVGIFGGPVSPYFYKLDDLKEWWKQHKPEFDALPWDSPSKDYEDAYTKLVAQLSSEHIPGKTVPPYKPKSEALREMVDNIRLWTISERELSVPEKHQLRIARDTLKMSDAGAKIMGGMTKDEARAIIKKLTGKEPKEEAVDPDNCPSECRWLDPYAKTGGRFTRPYCRWYHRKLKLDTGYRRCAECLKKGIPESGAKQEAVSYDLDDIVRQFTAFESFDALVNAAGGYTPTLRMDLHPELETVANAYDDYMIAHNNPKRAFRVYGKGKSRREDDVDMTPSTGTSVFGGGQPERPTTKFIIAFDDQNYQFDIHKAGCRDLGSRGRFFKKYNWKEPSSADTAQAAADEALDGVFGSAEVHFGPRKGQEVDDATFREIGATARVMPCTAASSEPQAEVPPSPAAPTPAARPKAFGARRPENQRMVDFLAQNGIPNVRVKYLRDGSLKGTWRLYDPKTKWSDELAAKLTELGFTNMWGEPLGKYDGNGGLFSTFVKGHNELLGESMTESDTQIANTILQQMGGAARLRVMLGVKHFVGHPDGVSFTWPNPQRSRGNGVRVTLMPDDTYKMEFVNATVGSIKPVQTYEGLYADQLVSTFERQTGWYLSLGRREAREGDPYHAPISRAARPNQVWETFFGHVIISEIEDDGTIVAVECGDDGVPYPTAMTHKYTPDAWYRLGAKYIKRVSAQRKEDGEPAPASEPIQPATKGPLVVMPTGEHGWRIARIKAGLDPKEVLSRHPDWKLPKGKPPTANTMMKWDADGVARATDGCKIEPDGVCIHGHPSWLLAMGVI